MGCTNIKRIYNKDYNPKMAYRGSKYEIEYWDVPCGKCIGCLSERSNRIANLMEYNYYEKYDKQAVFITLTYSNGTVPLVYEKQNEYEMEDATEIIINNKKYEMYDENGNKLKLDFKGLPIPTTNTQDFKDFMKRLRINLEREKLKTPICFVACTEYGETGNRPHMHAVILGLQKCYEIEKIVEKSWTKNGELIGLYDVAECNGIKAIEYVCKYVTKNLYWDDQNDPREKPKVWTSINIEKAVVDTEGWQNIIKNNYAIQYGKKDFNKVSLGRYLINKYNGKRKKEWDKLETYIKNLGIELNYKNEAERREQIQNELNELAKLKEKIKLEALRQKGIYGEATKQDIIDEEYIRKLAEECINIQN